MPALDLAVVAIVAWGLVASGAVEAWAYWPLAVASALVGGLAIAGSRGKGGIGWALPAGFGLLIASVAVQLVPLPRPLILRYSPATDAFVQRIGGYTTLLWGDPPPTHSLSVNPDRTLVGLCPRRLRRSSSGRPSPRAPDPQPGQALLAQRRAAGRRPQPDRNRADPAGATGWQGGW
jgi:hypothetical protein